MISGFSKQLSRTLLFAFLLFSMMSTWAQEDDKASIKKVIDDYIVGWRNGDADLLKKAFDLEAGVVLWIDKKSPTEKMKSMKLSELVNRNKVNKAYGIGYTIQNINIIDSQLAIAFVKIPFNKNHYIDCLELQKVNDQWKIVLKSYVYFRNK